MKQRIYIDTSVVGGYFDDEFKEATVKLFDEIKNDDFSVYISTVTVDELDKAPLKVKQLLDVLQIDYQTISLTDEAIYLANQYQIENVVGKTSYDDCLHIAIATIARLDVLVSWNFKHIVNLRRIKGYNGINLKNGYPTIEIRSPKDILNYENE